MEKKYYLKGLDCANCAQKIEDAVKKVPGIEKAQVDFAQEKLTYSGNINPKMEKNIKELVKKIEPEVTVVSATEEAESEEEEENNPLIRIVGVFLGLVLLHFLSLSAPLTFALYFILYLLISYDILLKAGKNIFRGEVFDENFLMAIATIGAFAIGEYPEAVAVMLFYQLGEYFQDLAVANSRKSIKNALSLRPDFAHVKKGDTLEKVAPNLVAIGETIVVLPGEKVPLDSSILKGSAYVDTAPLTGEAVPKHFQENDEILAGMIVKDAPLTMKVLKDDANSTAAKILALVENATSQKAPAEKFITRFAKWYTPAVVALAILLAVIPPLFFAQDFQTWLYRALTFLVISCPCALVISVPLSFFAGIGGASKNGVIIKGSQYLENLANLDTIVFDKTGTLTKGNFVLTEIVNSNQPKDLLQLAASIEKHSNHPISLVIQKENKAPLLPIENVKEIAGFGLQGTFKGEEIFVGNEKLLKNAKIPLPKMNLDGTLIHLGKKQEYLGTLVIKDEVKPEASDALTQLNALGVKQTIMLTGDNEKTAAEISCSLHLSEVKSNLLPQDKVTAFEEILNKSQKKVAFVGDGMNDAPVLARADVGISMGSLGSDAAIEASDVVIMEDNLSRLPIAMKVAKKTMVLVKENIIFALGVKFIVLILGALGIASMGLAVFADVGVTLIAVLNALRALKK